MKPMNKTKYNTHLDLCSETKCFLSGTNHTLFHKADQGRKFYVFNGKLAQIEPEQLARNSRKVNLLQDKRTDDYRKWGLGQSLGPGTADNGVSDYCSIQ